MTMTHERRKSTFFSKQITFGSVINLISMVTGLIFAIAAYYDFKHDTGIRLTKLETLLGDTTHLIQQQQTQINMLFDKMLREDHADNGQ